MDEDPLEYQTPERQPAMCGMAVASFVLSLFGPVFFFAGPAYLLFVHGIKNDAPARHLVDAVLTVIMVLPPIAAIVTGFIALRRIAKSAVGLRGEALGCAGISLGFLAAAYYVLAFVLWASFH